MVSRPVDLWSGEFGDQYIARNSDEDTQAASLRMLADALRGQRIASALELGANVGRNLRSLRHLYPTASLSAVEVNERACEELVKQGFETFHTSLEDVVLETHYDLVFTVAVLIHIEPSLLNDAYRLIYTAAERLILIAEYYSPTPVEVPYRGLQGALWKRDFAGELLDKYADLRLLSVGATYHRQSPGTDDFTWFLLEKVPGRNLTENPPI